MTYEFYLYAKSLHIIFIICWMSCFLYLPRLFVYHAKALPKGELDSTLKVMEYKVYYYIMIPSAIGSIVSGLYLLHLRGWQMSFNLHVKMTCVVGLLICHFLMGRYRQSFYNNLNQKSHVFFRFFNEIPTVLMVIIVFMIVFG